MSLFEDTGAPSISFKGSEAGKTRHKGTVTKLPELVQSRDFETGEAAFWPAKNGVPGNPKMSVVIGLDVDGEARSLWAQKPSSMFNAIGAALKVLGRDFQLGDVIEVAHVSDEPNKNPRLAAQKIYKAKITAGVAPAVASDDPWGSPANTDEAPF